MSSESATVADSRVCQCGSQGPFYRRHTRCAECVKQAARAWDLAHPGRHRLLERRGRGARIEHLDYERLMVKQHGACALCGSFDPGRGRQNFCVDHDHQTGQVRGLLCNACNHSLAFFEYRIDWLEAALGYLKNATVANPHLKES